MTTDSESIPPYDLKITYTSNLKTGEISFLVDYISESDVSAPKHQKDHERYVRKLLEASGILHGSCSVRIRHGVFEEVYLVRKQETAWEWQKVSSQQKAKITAPPASTASHPAGNQETVKNKKVSSQ